MDGMVVVVFWWLLSPLSRLMALVVVIREDSTLHLGRAAERLEAYDSRFVIERGAHNGGSSAVRLSVATNTSLQSRFSLSFAFHCLLETRREKDDPLSPASPASLSFSLAQAAHSPFRRENQRQQSPCRFFVVCFVSYDS